MSDVRVIGGGFTGTLAAYFLSHRGHHVTVIDPREHTGGMIQTIVHSGGDDETAANGFVATALIEQVADTIGVKLVPISALARQNRWLWNASAGRLTKWPLTFLESIGLAWRVVLSVVTRRLAPRAGETIEAWGLRTMGEPATRKLLGAVLLGIYAAPVNKLSATLVMGSVFGGGKKRKAAKPRQTGTVAPEKGMGQWFTAMRSHLEARGVKFVRDEAAVLKPGDGPTFVCTNAPAAATLLREVAPELAADIDTIAMVPVARVGLTCEPSPHDPRGFGGLFPPEGQFSALGVLFNSDIFPHRFDPNVRGEAWIMGGDVRPDVPGLDDNALLARVLADRARLGSTGKVLESRITRWPKAFPLYGVALEKTLEKRPAPPPNIHLAGNYLGKLGLSRIAAQIEETVEAFAP